MTVPTSRGVSSNRQLDIDLSEECAALDCTVDTIVEKVRGNLPDTEQCRDVFEQWLDALAMARKHPDEPRAIKHADDYLRAVQNCGKCH